MPQEGVVQSFSARAAPPGSTLLAAVGPLQFEVAQYRLESEYGAASRLEAAPWTVMRWLEPDPALANPSDLVVASGVSFGADKFDQPVVFFPNDWTLRYFMEKNPGLKLHNLPPVQDGGVPAPPLMPRENPFQSSMPLRPEPTLISRAIPRVASSLLLALILGLAASARPASRPAKLGPMYKGAIVMDSATGTVLFEDNADEVSPPASMTKLMTFAVLDDAIREGRIRLQTPITVNSADAKVGMLRDSTNVWLKKGEVFSVEELVYAMMIQSANDAAAAVARTVGGSTPTFVGMMNAKAHALGMSRTTFRSPNGFPPRSHRIADGDLTTPRDFALLCRYLVLHTNILKYTAVKSRAFGAGRRFPPVAMVNHNHLLGKVAGVDGLKTGFTNGAGFCLAATAARAGRRIIVVVMDCPDSRDRDLRVAQLLDRGFSTTRFIRSTISRSPPARAESAPAAAVPDESPVIKFAVPSSGY